MSLLRGSDTIAASGMNLAQKLARPKKLRTAAAVPVCLASVTTSTFALDYPISREESKWPMNSGSGM